MNIKSSAFLLLFPIALNWSHMAEASEPYQKVLKLQGITFTVAATNEASINHLTITAKGLKKANKPMTQKIDGSVVGAEVGDLDLNGVPEIYVYVTSAGSGSYGSLVAYAVNKGKIAVTEIYLPPVAEDPMNNKGYMGHDEFAVVEGTFVQRFPIYKGSDTNAAPTGGTRQLQYKLKPGEAGWKLVLDKVVE